MKFKIDEHEIESKDMLLVCTCTASGDNTDSVVVYPNPTGDEPIHKPIAEIGMCSNKPENILLTIGSLLPGVNIIFVVVPEEENPGG